MDSLFVVVGVMGLICAITVVVKVRAIGWGVWVWFFSGWITGEAAVWVVGLQLGFVALWILFVGTDSAAFGFGLSAFLASWAPKETAPGELAVDFTLHGLAFCSLVCGSNLCYFALMNSHMPPPTAYT